MEDIKALLSLLDDDDRIVKEQVFSRLSSYGLRCRMLVLDHFKHHPTEQTLELLYHLSLSYALELIQLYKKTGDFFAALNAISQQFEPDYDFDFLKEFTTFSVRSLAPLPPKEETKCFVETSHFLFQRQQFRCVEFGSKHTDYLLTHRAIKNKRFEPISLCILYYLISQEFGIPLHFVKISDMFFLKSEHIEMYIDPLGNGNLLTESELNLMLEINHLQNHPKINLNLTTVLILLIDQFLLRQYKDDQRYVFQNLQEIKNELLLEN